MSNRTTTGVRQCVCFIFVMLVLAEGLHAADWPTWRFDVSRTASSPQQLPGAMHLQWRRKLGALTPAWAEDARLFFDASYEPIVVGQTMFVASSATDSVTAIETRTGEFKWKFFADAPVRFAPVVRNGSVYFGADDGCIYCVGADQGNLIWKVSVAPTSRLVLGNDRLISVWPVRGGPVIVDQTLYFTIGVWPFEGTFLGTLDLSTAKEGTPPRLRLTQLPDVSPQGYLAAAAGRVYIPCGRGPAKAYLPATGQLQALRYDSRGKLDTRVTAMGELMFHGDAVYDAAKATQLGTAAHQPVTSPDMIFCDRGNEVIALDYKHPKTTTVKDRKGNDVKVTTLPVAWHVAGNILPDVPTDKELFAKWMLEHPLNVHLRAGDRLFGHQGQTVFALDLPAGDKAASISWKVQLQGTPARMVAADDRLFVVTIEGDILCFAASDTQPAQRATVHTELAEADADAANAARQLLDLAKARAGYGLIFGAGDGALLHELLRQSDLRLIVIDSDPAKIQALRTRYDSLGLYGKRIVARTGESSDFRFPQYIANLVVAQGIGGDANTWAKSVFSSLRPYGGTACIVSSSAQHNALADAVKQQKLEGAEVERSDAYTVLRRVGALIGASDWTHEWGDLGNTLMSHDTRVMAPLGLLWYGGPAASGDLFYDRHEWGPSMAVIHGRMFIQGPEKLTAVDVYTGRVLWQIALPKGNSFGRRANWVATGFNFVAVDDAIYLADNEKCIRLDPATGKQVTKFTLPDKDDQFGRFRVWDDLLIVTVFRSVEGRGNLPVKIVAMNRESGEVKWSKESRFAFPMMAIGNGKVYCYEGVLDGLYIGADKARRGGIPQADRFLYLRTFDARTGEDGWYKPLSQVATWVAYSQEHDVLLTSNKQGIRAWRGKDGEELWSKDAVGEGFKGHPENYWDKVIIWHDRILDQRGPGKSYSILTGEPIMRDNPITGEEVPWEFTKTGHHCNYAIASEYLMTFRAASAGFCDLTTGDTARLEGFRSGCRNSLLPADGVLNAPNFAHGCVCGYNIFTSLAFVHMPDSEMWTYSALTAGEGPVQHLGINFGAPGDRRDEDGTLWLNYPATGGSSPNVPIKLTPEKPQSFDVHSSRLEGDGLKWVAASGVRGLRSVTIPLITGKPPVKVADRSFTVRLHFAEPTDAPIGQNTFDVAVQGKVMLHDLDVVKDAGGPRRALVKELTGVAAGASMTITLTPHHGETVINGVEIVAE